MESAQKKLGSMDVEMPHLEPVSATVAACPAAVAVVGVWALITPFFLFLSYGVWAVVTSALSMFFPQRDAEASALRIGLVCCAALQAAAAVLAVRLPCRRVWVRYALAYLALALTIAGHWMCFAQGGFFPIADPGDRFYSICRTVGIFGCAAGDILHFLFLLLGPLLGVLGDVEKDGVGQKQDKTQEYVAA